jgi:hypothetical protein
MGVTLVQNAPAWEALCNHCATKNRLKTRRFSTPSEVNRGSEDTERVAQFLGGGFLIHSDPFALIDSHLFC